MKKYITLQFTQKEFDAVVDGIDTLSATVGSFDEDYNIETKLAVKSFDKVLHRAGFKRKYK